MPYSILSEYDSKKIYKKHGVYYIQKGKDNSIHTDMDTSDHITEWVVKVDQQIKGRGKHGLVQIGLTVDKIMDWISIQPYHRFIVEPVCTNIEKEYYICIMNYKKDGNIFTKALFSSNGGIDIGVLTHNSHIETIEKQIGTFQKYDWTTLLGQYSTPNLCDEIQNLYELYTKYHFVYMEINPLVQYTDGTVEALDFAVKYDDTSLFLWDYVPFYTEIDNSQKTEEEEAIEELDKTTGGSLKFKLINPNGSIWTLVAGGGASVAYMDAIFIRGWGNELGNYGEYSGNPSDEHVYKYTKHVLSVISKSQNINPFHLFVGGGIANFTLVDKTFNGILHAFIEMKHVFYEKKIKLWIRRAGPNYEIAMKHIENVCKQYNFEYHIFTVNDELTYPIDVALEDRSQLLQKKPIELNISESNYSIPAHIRPMNISITKVFVYGFQLGVVQNMLDFDYVIGKSIDSISIAGIIDITKQHTTNVPIFFGNREILIPVYNTIEEAFLEHPDADTILNYASFRSAYDITKLFLDIPQVKTIYIIAEGIPEMHSINLYNHAKAMNKTIIGPATVGGIFAGVCRIGNMGGTIENVMRSRLHTKGDVGLVTRSGGLLNELCMVISLHSNGIHTAISIGGDRFPCTGFIDIIQSYEMNPEIKSIVFLGEVGGTDELVIAQMLKNNMITKPIIGMCLGESGSYLEKSITFGHAGAFIDNIHESAIYKNMFMKVCGIRVPQSFNSFGKELDILWIDRMPIILDNPPQFKRKKAQFFSSICNETGEELMYNGIEVSQLSMRIGNIIGHLWFKKQLPDVMIEYIELILCLCADHGPAVSGAQNTIVTTRASKDIVSSLCSGLLTIGSKFGGAINQAAKDFYQGKHKNLSPGDLVKFMKDQYKNISGIGHKFKTKDNPDKRVEILHTFIKTHFTCQEYTNYAFEVEKITLKKSNTLILNVDGLIAVSFIDCMKSSGIFTEHEIDTVIENEILNGFFILARTIGFIGHHIDQKRLKQDLYRCPIDTICYL